MGACVTTTEQKGSWMQNPEGKVERYKTRLVAQEYSQTYSIDYDETFASVTKMSIVMTLISMVVNGGWKLHQLDVKNTFLHEDLIEGVYMEIPLGFGMAQTVGKLLLELKNERGRENDNNL
jgi:Reverse transcriptase (RNA-dependent DNA polymerase)